MIAQAGNMVSVSHSLSDISALEFECDISILLDLSGIINTADAVVFPIEMSSWVRLVMVSAQVAFSRFTVPQKRFAVMSPKETSFFDSCVWICSLLCFRVDIFSGLLILLMAVQSFGTVSFECYRFYCLSCQPFGVLLV